MTLASDPSSSARRADARPSPGVCTRTLLPPGIYILRIDVDTDSSSRVKNTVVQRLLHVAY